MDKLGNTDQNMNLKESAFSSGFFSLAAQLSKFLVNIVSTIILARLLTPGDFGLVGMVAVIVNFINLFKDIGFSTAIIQRKTITQIQVSTLFWININISLLIAVVTLIISPQIADFYDEPRIEQICKILALSFFLSGISVIHQGLLKRKMMFHKIAIIEIFSIVLGSIVAIILAVNSFQYWSLVYLQVITALSSTVLTMLYSKWVPSLKVTKEPQLINMVKYGSNLTGFNLLNYLSRNLDNILIGKFIGAAQLGLYSRAYSLFMLPLSQVNGPIASVAIPTLSKMTNDPDKYRTAYLKVIDSIAVVTMPLGVFMILSSYNIVYLFLGDQWGEASTVFSILAIFGIVQPIANSTGWLFATQDRTSDQLKWGFFSSILTVTSFIIGLPFGIEGVAASYVLTVLFLITPLLLWWVGRKGPVKTVDFYSIIIPKLIPTIFVFVAIRFWSQVEYWQNSSAVIQTIYYLISVYTFFFLALFFIPSGKRSIANLKEYYIYLRTILKGKFNRGS